MINRDSQTHHPIVPAAFSSDYIVLNEALKNFNMSKNTACRNPADCIYYSNSGQMVSGETNDHT